MAKYRHVQVQFWQDDFVITLTPEDKYFYLYLLTNTRSNQIGCYSLPKRMIEFETGYNRETVDKLIERFVNYGKIKYSEKTNEVFIFNWWRHNWTKSPKVETCILSEFQRVEDIGFKEELHSLLIDYGYRIDSLSIDLGEKEKSKNKKVKSKSNIYSPLEKDETPYEEIIRHLNSKSSKNFRHSTPKNKELIRTRWNEGFTLDDFKKVIDNKVADWLGTDYENYIRPVTLFSNKFESYLNENPKPKKAQGYLKPYDDEENKKYIEKKLKNEDFTPRRD